MLVRKEVIYRLKKIVEELETLTQNFEANPAGRPRNRKAETFLLEILNDGPKRTQLVVRKAKALKISRSTLRRARKELNIKTYKVGFNIISGQTYWEWKLPD